MTLSKTQKDEVEAAFASLVGEPLSDMWRYAEMQKFEFGVQKPAKNRKGEDITRADWGLVVNCDWRIDGPSGFVLSSEHFGPNRQRQDDHAKPFYRLLEDDPPLVLSIEVRRSGAIDIKFSGDYSLCVTPVPKEDPRDEEWRFMPSEDRSQGHLVLQDGGLE